VASPWAGTPIVSRCWSFPYNDTASRQTGVTAGPAPRDVRLRHQPDERTGQPDSLLDYPVAILEDMDSVAVTGQSFKFPVGFDGLHPMLPVSGRKITLPLSQVGKASLTMSPLTCAGSSRKSRPLRRVVGASHLGAVLFNLV
jgi:hypothetical protein